ncbi:MAG: hypothetical protein MUC66_08520 [Methanolinea sp.]|jgi:hypothetical protein|nr:hypothetical protein [Methanolinea sp.]
MMRPGILMLAVLLVSAWITATGLYSTPEFPIAVMVGAICTVFGILILRISPHDPALFLLAQPSLFLSWGVSPFLTLVLEAVLAIALLSSLDLLHTANDLVFPAIFLILMAVVCLLLSGSTHVVFPLTLLIPAAGLAFLLILGLAYRAESRTGGGMP